MNDGGPTCPLCGDECASRDHVRQHLHTSHRKFELIDACVGDTGADLAGPDSGEPAPDRTERTTMSSSRVR